ncbi:MAG: hypothetical protein A2749_00140 [Parcubacteria group bacterium RIFCSPHIGHO2_01_FULL_45_26]|nr:MAG: hypothetical protein A2749_00140 [Parcubacteria group bacterium RIFCSPHIGHO2_01_FULL_45_26]
MIKIKIIAGSTRPGRFNTQPVKWLAEIAKKRTDMAVEVLDLAEINLPIYDEAIPAMFKKYDKEHTKKWSTMIDEADGFVIVTPEYNHSIPGAIKNAIDFLNQEWAYKPVSFVSYGSLAGGSRAVEHLRGVAGELKMYDLREQLMLPNYWENLDDKGSYKFTEIQAKSANAILDSLVFWAGVMKDARAKVEIK